MMQGQPMMQQGYVQQPGMVYQQPGHVDVVKPVYMQEQHHGGGYV